MFVFSVPEVDVTATDRRKIWNVTPARQNGNGSGSSGSAATTTATTATGRPDGWSVQQEGESTEDHSRFRSALPLYPFFSPLSLSPSLSFCFSPFSLARVAAAAATRRLVGERRERENTRKRARERRRKRSVARKTELDVCWPKDKERNSSSNRRNRREGEGEG